MFLSSAVASASSPVSVPMQGTMSINAQGQLVLTRAAPPPGSGVSGGGQIMIATANPTASPGPSQSQPQQQGTIVVSSGGAAAIATPTTAVSSAPQTLTGTYLLVFSLSPINTLTN